MTRTFECGFTLIEVLVVVALIAILALVGAPLGRAWVANANLENSENILKEGYAFARSLALENRGAAVGSQPAATLSIDDGRVIVTYSIRGLNNAGTNIAGTTETLWWRTLNRDVSAQLDAKCTAASLQLTNMGLPLNVSCLNVTLTAGGVDDLNISLQP